MFSRVVRQILDRVLQARGYRLAVASAAPIGLERFASSCLERGFEPATVIDVGVGHGTPWLYSAFPRAALRLFEPLREFERDLRSIREKSSRASYDLVALGSRDGEREIVIYTDTPTSSTMAEAVAWKPENRPRTTERRIVPVRRLDSFGPFEGPVLLKIDSEGMESEVVNGATKTLENTELVIAEVSVRRRHKRELLLAEFVMLMHDRGFQLLDVPELTPVRPFGPLAYIDVAFAKEGSGLLK